MARLRYNGLVAALGGSGLTNSATSVTFAAALTYNGGTNVPTISGSDYIPLTILDAAGTAVSEVVWLTAYTAAATTGTITRGKEGTTGVTHSAGDTVVHAPTMMDIGVESWDDVVADIPNKVHRWQFEETSGATIADSIGSLTLTCTGVATTNYIRNATGPTGLGKAITFVNGLANSSGLGSIPVGGADRTIVWVFRTTALGRMVSFNYGANSNRNFCFADLNNNGTSTQSGGFFGWGDGGTEVMALSQMPISDGEWHLAALGLRGGNSRQRFLYYDRNYGQGATTNVENTTNSGNFQLGFTGLEFVGDVADMFVCNAAVSRLNLDRLYRALNRVNAQQ